MAMIKCEDCSGAISSGAIRCPICGAKTGKGRTRTEWQIFGLFLAVAAAWVLWTMHQGEQQRIKNEKEYQEAIDAANRFLDSRRH